MLPMTMIWGLRTSIRIARPRPRYSPLTRKISRPGHRPIGSFGHVPGGQGIGLLRLRAEVDLSPAQEGFPNLDPGQTGDSGPAAEAFKRAGLRIPPDLVGQSNMPNLPAMPLAPL